MTTVVRAMGQRCVKWRDPGSCSAGDWGAGEMGDGVARDGVRTVPFSLKATVELVQFICKSQVIDGVEGFRFCSVRAPSRHNQSCWLRIGVGDPQAMSTHTKTNFFLGIVSRIFASRWIDRKLPNFSSYSRPRGGT